MKKALEIILSCTNRKRTGEHSVVGLGEIRAVNLDDRAQAWIAAMDHLTPIGEASDIYAGEYWRAAMELAAQARGSFEVSVWVLSAGLGLVSAHDKIPAYSATFASGHADSVVAAAGGRHARRRWWALLSDWRGPCPGDQPRSLAALAARRPHAGMLVCVGPDYLDAVHDDLLRSRVALNAPSQLVVCGSEPPGSVLSGSWVHMPGRLRTRVGGSMASTSLRAATIALDTHTPGMRLDVEAFRLAVDRLLATSEDLPRFDRQSLDDAAVRNWIRRHMTGTSSATKSSALREFRSSGFACEQRRFGRLFAEVEGLPG